MGLFGKEVRRFSALLLEHHLVHVLVSDAHGLNMRSPKLSEACHLIESMKGREVMRKMTCETPERIIRGEPVAPDDPIPIPARSSAFTLWKRLSSSFLTVIALRLFLSACMQAGGPAIREIHPGEGAPVSPSPALKPETGEPAVREIETAKTAKEAEEKLIRLQRLELSTRDYIREKFHGKQVVFPEELPQEGLERPTGFVFTVFLRPIVKSLWEEMNYAVLTLRSMSKAMVANSRAQSSGTT